MKRIATLIVFLGLAMRALPQIPVPPPAAAASWRSAPELDQLLGPIALYPDPLIAEILPAATLPADLVVVDRYLRLGGDLNVIDRQPWDPSLEGLAGYTTVLNWMDDNLTWTADVGHAFLAQEAGVVGSSQ